MTPDYRQMGGLVALVAADPWRASAFLIGSLIVCLYAGKDFGPRITAIWAAPRQWYSGALSIYVLFVAMIYVIVMGATMAILSWVIGKQWASSEGAQFGPGLLSYSVGVAATLLLFHAPGTRSGLLWVRGGLRGLAGMPGYVEQRVRRLSSAAYSVPPARRNAIADRLNRLGLPTQAIDWDNEKHLAFDWTKLSSIVLRLAEWPHGVMSLSPLVRAEVVHLLEEYQALAQSAARVFGINRLHREVMARVGVPSEGESIVEIRARRRVQKRMDWTLARLLEAELRRDVQSMLTKSYVACIRVAVETGWSRRARDEHLQEMGFQVKPDRGMSAKRLLLVFVGTAATLVLVAFFFPVLIAAFPRAWGLHPRNAGLSPDRVVMIASMYAGAVWAAVLCRRFWGWVVVREGVMDHVAAICGACVIAGAIWCIVGFMWDMVFVPPQSVGGGELSMRGVLMSALRRRGTSSPWMIIIVTTSIGVYLLCGMRYAAPFYTAGVRRIIDGAALAAALGIATIPTMLLLDLLRPGSGADPAVVLVINVLVGMFIGLVFPEWQRIAEQDAIGS